MSVRSRFSHIAVELVGILAAAVGGCAPSTPPIDLSQAYADARATLDRGLADEDAFTRSHTIEALAETVGLHAGAAYERALADPSPLVRFAAALAIGDTRYAPAKTRLLKMADDKQLEPDRRVMPAVIYALYTLGDTTYAGDLYPLLFDREREVRANAALAMGKMGEPSGIGPLKTRLNDEQDPLVRLQIIESLALLGDSVSALGLEAYTKKTPFMDERLVAIPAMARVRSSTAPRVLNDLLDMRQPPRVRVSAAGALGMLGQSTPTGYALCLAAVRNPQAVLDRSYGGRRAGSQLEVSSLQRLAALSLGWLGNKEAVGDLHRLLDSEDGAVRAAAAMSILRLLPAYQRPLHPAALSGARPTPRLRPVPPSRLQPAPEPQPQPPIPPSKPQPAMPPAEARPKPQPAAPPAEPEPRSTAAPEPAETVEEPVGVFPAPPPAPSVDPAPAPAPTPPPEPYVAPAHEPTPIVTPAPTEPTPPAPAPVTPVVTDVTPAETSEPNAKPAPPTPRKPLPLKLRTAGGKD